MKFFLKDDLHVYLFLDLVKFTLYIQSCLA